MNYSEPFSVVHRTVYIITEGFPVQFISSLTHLDNNSQNVPSMYILPQHYISCTTTSSNILHSSTLYSFNHKFQKKLYGFLTAD